MTPDRLRMDLADLADDVTPVDLRDRALRTSRRLGIQRTVAASAAVLVLVGAAAGTALALRPRDNAAPVLPADSPSPTVTVGPSVKPTLTPTPATSRVSAPTKPNVELTDIYYYSWPDNTGKFVPAKLWRKKPGEKWQVVQTGPARVVDDGTLSPDGRHYAWFDTTRKPFQVKVSNFDGGGARTVATFDDSPCGPLRWLDNGRIAYGYGQGRDTWVAVDIDGSDRKVLISDVAACGGDVLGAAGRLIHQQSGRIFLTNGVDARKRTVIPQLPSGLKVHELAGLSPDGSQLVVGAHEPTAGECSCGWQLRHFLVDVKSGSAIELALLDPGWNKEFGVGWIKGVTFLPSGGFVAQVNTVLDTTGAPRFRLAVYLADGRVVSSIDVPSAGTHFGTLLG